MRASGNVMSDVMREILNRSMQLFMHRLRGIFFVMRLSHKTYESSPAQRPALATISMLSVILTAPHSPEPRRSSLRFIAPGERISPSRTRS